MIQYRPKSNFNKWISGDIVSYHMILLVVNIISRSHYNSKRVVYGILATTDVVWGRENA